MSAATTTASKTAKPSAVSAGDVGPSTANAPSNAALEQVIALTRRLRMPYLRAAALDVVPTARAQRWDPAELLRVLLGYEITGRDQATLRARRRAAGFPTGKTFDIWGHAPGHLTQTGRSGNPWPPPGRSPDRQRGTSDDR